MTTPEDNQDPQFAAFSRELDDLEILAVPTPQWALALGDPHEGITWQERQGLDAETTAGRELLVPYRDSLSGGMEVEQADRDAAFRTAQAAMQQLFRTEDGRDGMAYFNALQELYAQAEEQATGESPATMFTGPAATPGTDPAISGRPRAAPRRHRLRQADR